jgi:hypothetical protein
VVPPQFFPKTHFFDSQDLSSTGPMQYLISVTIGAEPPLLFGMGGLTCLSRIV